VTKYINNDRVDIYKQTETQKTSISIN